MDKISIKCVEICQSYVVAVLSEFFCGCFSNITKTAGDYYAFSNCKSIPSIIFPNSVKTIGLSAFSNNEALETVDFGRGVTDIGSYAFARCTNLYKVIFPESLKELKMLTFFECINLKEEVILYQYFQNIYSITKESI